MGAIDVLERARTLRQEVDRAKADEASAKAILQDRLGKLRTEHRIGGLDKAKSWLDEQRKHREALLAEIDKLLGEVESRWEL